jgi:CheY-like chemotaxis protein
MRPKKVVLVVDGNVERLSIKKFLIDTHGYRVITASSADEALATLRSKGVNLMAIDLPLVDRKALVSRAMEIDPEVSTAIVSGLTAKVLIDRVKGGVAGKRGPKPRRELSAPMEASVQSEGTAVA